MANSYRIRIKGHLDTDWVDWFDGFSFTHQDDGSTLLTGVIADQPALYSLLKRIHDLGLHLTLVEQLENGKDSTGTRN